MARFMVVADSWNRYNGHISIVPPHRSIRVGACDSIEVIKIVSSRQTLLFMLFTAYFLLNSKILQLQYLQFLVLISFLPVLLPQVYLYLLLLHSVIPYNPTLCKSPVGE